MPVQGEDTYSNKDIIMSPQSNNCSIMGLLET